MAKMFYNQAEAAQKLGISTEELKKMVRDGRLREFMDNGPVYRVEDIDKMGAAQAAPSGTEDVVDLELVEPEGEPGKEDTVITSAGISVFDDEDLEIEADPLAQTQITQSVEDQISLETTGSGSGLLDLTREADDTSLGAELLDEIYPTAPTVESADVVTAEPEPAMDRGMTAAVPQVIEASDPYAPAFSALAVVGVLVAGFLLLVVAAVWRGIWPGFLETLADGNNPYIFGGAAAVLAVLFWVVGMVVGKSSAGPRM